MRGAQAGGFEVLYLTGAPASGKTSVTRALAEQVAPLKVFEYGDQLTRFIGKRQRGVTQEDIRTHSSSIATAEDIHAVDRQLLAFVKEHRTRSHVVIDSHAVTKEGFGFRVTAYSVRDIARLRPTIICVLYATPRLTRARIAKGPAGRPLVNVWEADFHTQLQASIALGYAIRAGAPAYFIDSSGRLKSVVTTVARLLIGQGRSKNT